jgi:nitrate/TMAO reductase-like tetraheme cytochrome c subunit
LNEAGTGPLRRAFARIRRLPPILLVALGAGVAALAVRGGVELYRTYDYIQHDNDFCLSCHLMVDPYERFAKSAHRDLGCKACHRPTLVTRSTMALTQIVENPDSLEAHAEVSNGVCIECHVDGDPEKWSIIAGTAGHQVHLESDDPELAGLECVECHSTSVHEFAASDRTCGQAGCHESQEIRLGGMGALTIHCATCHEFSAPVGDATREEAQLAFRPQREECLSCHAMRERLAAFPLAADDPHGGMCGACHNPHSQTEPVEAFQSCATSGCHMQPDTITPFHRGLDAGTLENCAQCHTAHTFHAEGRDCIACHTDAAQPGRVSPPPGTTHPPITSYLLRPLRLLASLFLPSPAMAQQATIPFDHARHTEVACTACHSVADTHGRVTVTGVRECRECHHTGATAQPCSRCHAPSQVPTAGSAQRRTYRPVAGATEMRSFPFEHRSHAGVACAQCHREGLVLSAARVECRACHEEHHEPDNACIACHQPPPPTAHTRTAHLTCAGSGCHTSAPVAASQRTRNLCLACHQDLTDHQPGRTCVDCHTLPAARPAGGEVEPVEAGG